MPSPPPALAVLAIFSASVYAQSSTLSAPGQPQHTGTVNGFENIGDSLVSAQQIFLGGENKVYFVDKTENNAAQVKGHPAWASDWSLSDNKQRTMDAYTNAFCAGGNVLGNGTWLNVGGNQAVTYGGQAAQSQTGGGVYDDPDGRNSIRILDPCDDDSCNWRLGPDMTTRRWYPTLETLEDGTMIILGGCNFGGYVNDAAQDNPTIEFFPSRGDPQRSNILATTLPTNLYPLTWLLPSGKILIQSNWKTALLDSKTLDETPLDDMVGAVRTYPASAGTAMLPLTPANNWTATIIFCGGTNLQSDQWTPDKWNIAAYPASDNCARITPDNSRSYEKDDPLPEGRSMANFIFLPDGKIFMANGAKTGTAGYGNQSWALGMSYADGPLMTPAYYDYLAPSGSRWNRDGLQSSTIARMYHSSATLLPDGSVMISGSNPNSDLNTGPNVPYPTEYRTEKFYPWYFSKRRPQPNGLLSQYSYGGASFNVYLSSDDLFGDVNNLKNASVVILRTGFSTHSMNMGQRYLQLDSTYTGYKNNTGILHVSQMPPNAAIFAPGPALVFVVVNGVPSVGKKVMIGNGQLGDQQTQAVGDLPSSNIFADSNGSGSGSSNAGSRVFSPGLLAALPAIISVLASRTFW